MKRIHILFVVLACCVCAIPFGAQLRQPLVAMLQIIKGKKTIADRLQAHGDAVRARLAADFERLHVSYPPAKMALIGLKAENVLEVWVAGADQAWKHLKSYPILAASGHLGPKTQEGDGQVPEGLYRVEALNPNSLYHLSLRLNYPNPFDREMARAEQRTQLGGDIMIHGSKYSVGCLAMGDEAAEDLFVLAAETGIDKVMVILSPVDFRRAGLPPKMPPVPKWTGALYEAVKSQLLEFM